MTCRVMTLDDVDALMELEQRSSEYPWSSRESFERPAASGGGLVLESDGALVGYLVFAPDDDVLHLIKMAVDPAWRRQGFGGLLLQTIEERARIEQRFSAIRLHVRESNSAAVRLYHHHGYTVVEEVDDYYRSTGRTASDRKALTMVKPIGTVAYRGAR